MASIDDLIEEHGEETVRKAFWLQEHIYEEGLAGVRFSDVAEEHMRQSGPRSVKRKIENNTKRDF
jgi:hypothetical protein